MTNSSTPDLDLLGTYLYLFLYYHPLHPLTKTLTLAWLGLLSCTPHMISSSTCTFTLHVFFFLPDFFSFFVLYSTKLVISQKWACTQQAPNNNIWLIPNHLGIVFSLDSLCLTMELVCKFPSLCLDLHSLFHERF